MKPLAQNTLIQNRYLIVQLIGKGGMGEVYLAVDQRLGSAIALKRTFFAGDEALGNAFEREARVLARMRHPVLPKVSDHFGEGDEQFLVMEHISGDDLSKRIEAAQKPFPLSWVMFWADQLLDALSYLHSHEPPIIHRDIKPQNLKLTDENHIILLDFGLSKSSTGQTNLGSSSSTSSTGSVVGYTPHYAPMEQIRGIGTSPRSDIYSLSATLYQLLTNTVPIDALSRADTMLNGLDDPVRPLDEINPEVPREISNVILRGMEVSQDKRFETARDMQKALRRAYNEMQNAMSAKTVVIGNADLMAAGGVEHSGNTDPSSVAAMEPAESLEPDFAATIMDGAFPDAQANEPELQSGIKTEVFIPGAIAYVPDEPTPAEPVYNEPAEEPALPDFGMTNVYESDSLPNDEDQSSAFEPGATVPGMAFGDISDREQFEPEEDRRDETPAVSAAVSSSAVTNTASAKKKGGSGKVIGIVAGLLILFLIGVFGAVAVWYYMNYMSGSSDPTPSPTPIESPVPSPTSEVTIPSPTESSSPTPTVTPEATPESTPSTQRTPNETRPAPTVRQTPVPPRPNPTRPPSTPVPATPRPTPRRTPLQ